MNFHKNNILFQLGGILVPVEYVLLAFIDKTVKAAAGAN